MDKEQKERRELKAIRVQLAITLVTPNLAVYHNYLHFKQTGNQSCNTVAVQVLAGLIKAEPSIEKILSLYVDKIQR